MNARARVPNPSWVSVKLQQVKRQNIRLLRRLSKRKGMKISQTSEDPSEPLEDLILLGRSRGQGRIVSDPSMASTGEHLRQLAKRVDHLVDMENLPPPRQKRRGRPRHRETIRGLIAERQEVFLEEWRAVCQKDAAEIERDARNHLAQSAVVEEDYVLGVS